MLFHPTQLEALKKHIQRDLLLLERYGSIKLYICCYDQYMIPDSEWKGLYPCSDKSVYFGDVIDIVKQIMTQPYILRHNVLNCGPFPACLMDKRETQDECEKYVEVCLIQNIDERVTFQES
jgi:hypothetical protein